MSQSYTFYGDMLMWGFFFAIILFDRNKNV